MNLNFPIDACSHLTHAHASQLFKMKEIPQLLKTVVDKPLATASQVSHHVSAATIQDEETVQDESTSQFAIADSISTSTNLPPEISLTLAPTQSQQHLITSTPAPQRQHHMITRTQIGKLKPKIFIYSRHPILPCLVADLVAQPQEPSLAQQALQHPQ